MIHAVRMIPHNPTAGYRRRRYVSPSGQLFEAGEAAPGRVPTPSPVYRVTAAEAKRLTERHPDDPGIFRVAQPRNHHLPVFELIEFKTEEEFAAFLQTDMERRAHKGLPAVKAAVKEPAKGMSVEGPPSAPRGGEALAELGAENAALQTRLAESEAAREQQANVIARLEARLDDVESELRDTRTKAPPSEAGPSGSVADLVDPDGGGEDDGGEDGEEDGTGSDEEPTTEPAAPEDPPPSKQGKKPRRAAKKKAGKKKPAAKKKRGGRKATDKKK